MLTTSKNMTKTKKYFYDTGAAFSITINYKNKTTHKKMTPESVKL